MLSLALVAFPRSQRTVAPFEATSRSLPQSAQRWRYLAAFAQNPRVVTELNRIHKRIKHLEHLHRIGVALGAEHDRDRLVERILVEAKDLCHADGGTLYLRTDDDHLRFTIMRNDSLGLVLGGTTGKQIDLPAVPMFLENGEPNHRNVASYCATTQDAVNIPDAYEAEGFDFSGTKAFDARNGYRSQSFLTIPLINQEQRVIGVLQLLNAKDGDRTVAFDAEVEEIVWALAAQAGVAFENQMLLSSQRELMEAFIMLIAGAIDDKSPYTGGHCRRVPQLAQLLTEAVCQTRQGPYADFSLTEEQWYELKVAAWLHDCGKVTTPVHVMDKATKLETIYDRIETIRTRFATCRQALETQYYKGLADGGDAKVLQQTRVNDQCALDDDLAFLQTVNIGGEFMTEAHKDRVRAIGRRTWVGADGQRHPLLTEDEITNLTISRGTLTDEERVIINGHMVQTIRMLEALPFPRNLRRVPEYAGGHHEKMDGTGYPKGLFAGDMSVPARIMAIADVFEALTATDRPYKTGKTLSATMHIMGSMKRDNHLDPDLFNIFISSRVYRQYAEQYLPPELIDEVDEAALLAIEAKPFSLPERAVRDERWRGFRPAYQGLVRDVQPL